jgi:hypothetical protein
VEKQAIFNTCWRTQLEYLLGEDKNTEKNESGFDYTVEKTDCENACRKKGNVLWRANELATFLKRKIFYYNVKVKVSLSTP